MDWTDGSVEDSCEHGNEPSGSIKRWETLKWLHNWWFLRKGSPQCSYRTVQYLPAKKATVNFKGHVVSNPCNPQKPTKWGLYIFMYQQIPQMVMFVALCITMGHWQNVSRSYKQHSKFNKWTTASHVQAQAKELLYSSFAMGL
jgi:hypothetical protein